MNDRRLSRDFVLAEFVSPDLERVPPGYVQELAHLCSRYLQPLRDEFGRTTVHSGHRSDAHNRRVGGARQSRHRDLPGVAGAAADVSCDRGRPADWYRFLDRLGAPGLGLYPGHVHVDNRRGRARW